MDCRFVTSLTSVEVPRKSVRLPLRCVDIGIYAQGTPIIVLTRIL